MLALLVEAPAAFVLPDIGGMGTGKPTTVGSDDAVCVVLSGLEVRAGGSLAGSSTSREDETSPVERSESIDPGPTQLGFEEFRGNDEGGFDADGSRGSGRSRLGS